MDTVLCIPNFSEGRRPEVVAGIVEAIASHPEIVVLDQSADADHNRCVITFVGPGEAVVQAAFSAAEHAARVIDLTTHTGNHPRMGATDVIPLVPLEGTTMSRCVRLARQLGQQVGERLGIPVYLYEEAATRPERRNLADIRKGEFEGIAREIGLPGREPDFGPPRVHPTAGAMAVGARLPLIAFNVNLNTPDLKVAKAVAKAVRGSSGGLVHVKALGMPLAGRSQVQVSMNLVNYVQTPIHRALELVRLEAGRYGAAVTGTELVGLVPVAALLQAAAHYLQLEDFAADQVLEHRLEAGRRTRA
ncbi:MAG TPA: glutamate formimidoyltransferase [Clostridiales bacterium UBA8153]|nr:glutamate formimidoyltransferase [Clostridiales bacterium UBA8153]